MKALVLAGGFPQIDLVEDLHERGIYVILADYNIDPPARKYADKFYRESTLDVDAIRKIAVEEKVDFLVAVCTDQALLTVGLVSEELGLPSYVDYRTALNVTNKQYMKDVFAKNHISTAKHVTLASLDEKSVEGLTYPLMVKPVDCNSSKGVMRCNNYEELKVYFADAVRLSRTDTAIVEEFIEGRELTVDYYVEEGKSNLITYSETCSKKDGDKLVICRTISPAAVSDNVVSQLEKIGQQIADAFGLKNSPMLMQGLVRDDTVYVIEFSARTGGALKHLLVEIMGRFDMNKTVVDLILGKKPHFERRPPEFKFLLNTFVHTSGGTFDHLEGFEEEVKNGDLYGYYPFHTKGDTFGEKIRSSGDRVVGYTVVGETPEEMIEKDARVRSAVKVIDDKGNDIMRHDLFTELYSENGKLRTK